MPIGEIQPPAVHPDDEPLVCIAINEQWVSYLLGMVWPAKYPEYWSGTLEENRVARKDVMTLMQLISEASEDCDMAKNCCVDVQITYRIDPTSGIIVQSSDGGTTWQPAAGGIPSVIVQPEPPVTSGVAGTKCDAATNVQTQVQAWIDQVATDFDTATTLLDFAIAVLEAILAAVLAIVSAGTLTALEALILPALGAALTAAFGAGKVAFEDYWTPEALSIILCAAFCNIGDDGSFTDAQFSAFWHKCNSDLPVGPAKMLFMGFLSSVGKEGLNAMAASGTNADADCGDCICFDDCAAHWSIFGDDPTHFHGQITEHGDGFIIVQSGPVSTNSYILIRTENEDQCCVAPLIEVIDGSFDGGATGWCTCGETPVEGAPCHSGLFGDTVCVNYLQFQAPQAFTMKITFAECP